jgi:hypothetical protein
MDPLFGSFLKASPQCYQYSLVSPLIVFYSCIIVHPQASVACEVALATLGITYEKYDQSQVKYSTLGIPDRLIAAEPKPAAEPEPAAEVAREAEERKGEKEESGHLKVTELKEILDGYPAASNYGVYRFFGLNGSHIITGLTRLLRNGEQTVSHDLIRGVVWDDTKVTPGSGTERVITAFYLGLRLKD